MQDKSFTLRWLYKFSDVELTEMDFEEDPIIYQYFYKNLRINKKVIFRESGKIRQSSDPAKPG